MIVNASGDHKVTPVLDKENPWPGLAPFEEGDAAFFHGRTAAIEALLQLVGREDLVLLYGVSGLGKTSLLRAGLFPNLPRSILPVYIRLHFDVIADGSGTDALRQQVLSAVIEEAQERRIEVPSAATSRTLWEFFRRRDQPFWGPGNEIVVPLLVFDQFEQLFTRNPERSVPREEIDGFLEDLGDTVLGRIPRWLEARLQSPTTVDRYIFESTGCKAIVSFREEYLADVKRLRTVIQSTDRNSIRLELMRWPDAVDAVRKAAGHLLTPLSSDEHQGGPEDVAAAIVTQVAGPAHRDEPPAIDPAILSVFCTELNHARKSRAATGGSPMIDLALVHDKRSSEIIEGFYYRAVQNVPVQVRRFIEDRLVLPSGTRNSVALEEVAQAGLGPDVITPLIEQWRILRREVVGRQGQIRLELTHDVLVRPVMHDRRAREEDEKRAPVERRRLYVGIACTVAGLLLAAAIVFYGAWRFERSSDLAKHAQRVQFLEPLRGLLLAIEAGDLAGTEDAENALRGALALPHPRTLLDDNDLLEGDFNRLGTEFGAVGRDGVAQIWDTTTGRVLASEDGYEDPLLVRFLSDGRVLIAGMQGARLWDRTRGSESLLADEGGILSFDVSRSGQWLAASRIGSAPLVWKLQPTPQRMASATDGERDPEAGVAFDDEGSLLLETGFSGMIRVLSSHTGQARAVHRVDHGLTAGTMSGDGRLVAVGSANGTILFDVGDDSLIERARIDGRNVSKVTFSRDSTRVMSLGESGVQLSDANGTSITEVKNEGEPQWLDAAQSPDGSIIAVARSDGAVRVWTLATGAQLLRSDKNPVRRVIFTADGSLLATISDDGTAAIWDIGAPLVEVTDLPFNDLRRTAQERVPKGLTDQHRLRLMAR